MFRIAALAAALSISACVVCEARADGKLRPMLRLELNGRKLEGTPLRSDRSSLTLLDRDGRLWDFETRDVTSFQETTSRFESRSAAAMQSSLRQEFGREYEVAATRHYLVVYPRGAGKRWSERFEDLYRSFVHYFSVRGFELEEPEFPLVAIVLRNQAEFVRYAQDAGRTNAAGLLGYYSPQTNRVVLFDAGERAAEGWRTADTIIHEATHQTAFNTGIHSRFVVSPRWAVEGLATMFEAPGVWNSRANLKDKDRLNQARLKQFKQQVASGSRGPVRFAELVSSDRLFDADSQAAYAEAWALTYYLIETRPRQFCQYLQRTIDRPDFSEYNSAQRLRDFTAIFGENLKLLDSQFLEYLERLRQ